MPDLDKIRDAVVLLLQSKKDWMTVNEIQSRIHGIEIDQESCLRVLQSIVRKELAEDEYFGENRGNQVHRWRAINMLPTKDEDSNGS